MKKSVKPVPFAALCSIRDVKFVYFDIGGVVILDFSKTTKFHDYFTELGMNDIQFTMTRDLFIQHAEDICDGSMSIFELQNKISKLSGYNFALGTDLTREFVDRFEVNPTMEELIQTIQRGGYRVGLLTNMYDGMLELIAMKGILPAIHWDEIVDSSVVKAAKPSQAIYELAEKQSRCQASHILFVENSSDNIKAAKQLGWKTYMYDPSKTQQSSAALLELLGV